MDFVCAGPFWISILTIENDTVQFLELLLVKTLLVHASMVIVVSFVLATLASLHVSSCEEISS